MAPITDFKSNTGGEENEQQHKISSFLFEDIDDQIMAKHDVLSQKMSSKYDFKGIAKKMHHSPGMKAFQTFVN